MKTIITCLLFLAIFTSSFKLSAQNAMPRLGEVTSVLEHPTYIGTVTGDYRIYPRNGVAETNSIQIQQPIIVVEGWDPLDNFKIETHRNKNISYIHIVLS